MYPNLYYAFKDIFGAAPSGLRFINSFGFFVAIAFIVAAIVAAVIALLTISFQAIKAAVANPVKSLRTE